MPAPKQSKHIAMDFLGDLPAYAPTHLQLEAAATKLAVLLEDARAVATPAILSGTDVTVTRDDGSLWFTRTRTEPWRLGDGTWVVGLEGRAGGYPLARVRRREGDEGSRIIGCTCGAGQSLTHAKGCTATSAPVGQTRRREGDGSSRTRVPGDGPRCWCGSLATFGGFCNEHCVDGKGILPSVDPSRLALTAAFERLLAHVERRAVRAEGPSPREADALVDRVIEQLDAPNLNWGAFSLEDLVEARRTIPKDVAYGWLEERPGVWVRYDAGSMSPQGVRFAQSVQLNASSLWVVGNLDERCQFVDLEPAKQAADDYLRERGWVLTDVAPPDPEEW